MLKKLKRVLCLISKFSARTTAWFLFAAAGSTGHCAAGKDWPVYLGDPGSSHYSTLDQINKSNVAQLTQAWIYHSNTLHVGQLSQIQCNPLVVDGVLYGTTPQIQLIALDADTGRERWRFDPFAGAEVANTLGVNRGVVHWTDGKDRRLLFTAGSFLYEIDATSGKLVSSFGDEGRVDLKTALGPGARELAVLSNTPGAVFENLIVMPLRVAEGPGPAAPGYICAYDLRTGKLSWVFHTIPKPEEFGYETWPTDAWQRTGGANCWAGMAVDVERALMYVPTGSATYDMWGGNRMGANLFADCLLCLDAKTGKRVWHFQFVHHDLWDRDLPSPPNLLNVKREGRSIPAVAQVTKSGHVFVFDRQTGAPLFPIEESAVPASDLAGESSWPTQPLPVKPAPFARQVLSYDDLTNLSPEAHQRALARFAKLRPSSPFMPPSREGTLIFPGFDGGAEWGGAAVHPDGVLYVNSSETPWILTMAEPKEKGHGGESTYGQICATCHGPSREGNPAQNIPNLTEIAARLSRPQIVALLTTGKGVMPAFTFLSVPQREAVADYLLGKTARSDKAAALKELESLDTFQRIPYVHTGYERWLVDGYPASKPPWGTLNAIDLNTGKYLWRVPLGEYPELTARGIPPTGTDNYGGPVVTAGDIIFIASTKDEMIRAFDRSNGKVLWQAKLPAAGYATPATYSVNGRQYVVIACGGGKLGTQSGDAYVAFALPDSDKLIRAAQPSG